MMILNNSEYHSIPMNKSFLVQSNWNEIFSLAEGNVMWSQEFNQTNKWPTHQNLSESMLEMCIPWVYAPTDAIGRYLIYAGFCHSGL